MFPAQALISWFKKNSRAFPWRNRRGVYGVWISEVMLQQTQASRVIPFYKKWMQRFPSLNSLAQARDEEALLYFEGLGYYKRFHGIMKTARLLSGKSFPKQAELLNKLPGVGKYTAAAIASLVFKQRVAVIDGNVARVLSRYFAIESSCAEIAKDSKTEALVESILPKREYAVFSEALIELGAVVCKKQQPSCNACPLALSCAAWLSKRVERYPLVLGRAQKKVFSTIGIIEKDNQFLLLKRENKTRLTDMWEFPILEHHKQGLSKQAIAKGLREQIGEQIAIEELNLLLTRKLFSFSHSYTSFKAYVEVWASDVKLSHEKLSKKKSYRLAKNARYVRKKALLKKPFGAAAARVREYLLAKAST